MHGSSSSVAKGARWRWKGERIPEEVYECSKAHNEYRNLCRQFARSLRMLVAISAHLLRSYDFHSSTTESSQFVLGFAKYVNEPSGRISHHAAGSRLCQRAAQLPTAPKHVDNQSAALETDYTFALRHSLRVRRKIRDCDHAIAEYATQFSLRL